MRKLCKWRRPIRCKEIVKLNSVVSELVNLSVLKPTTIFFKRSTAGWIYIEHGGLKVRLDKKYILLYSGEAMRFVSAGKHRIEIQGGHIIVRAIPEIVFYDFYERDTPPPKPRIIRPWSYHRQYGIWNNYNVMVSLGDIEQYTNHVAEWRAKGGKWIQNAGIGGPQGSPHWHEMMIDPRSDGIIVDEFQTEAAESFPAWAQIIRDIKADPASKGQMFYGYMYRYGVETNRPIIEALLDSGYKVAPEAYWPTQPAERDDDFFLDKWTTTCAEGWKELFGARAIKQMLLTLCPIDFGYMEKKWNKYDYVDFKVHLDKTFHEIVNSVGFIGLGGVSLWRVHYLTDEMLTHVNSLVRHYLIEGNTERMTDDPYIIEGKAS